MEQQDIHRNSIQIYRYQKEQMLAHDRIRNKINDVNTHEISITLKNDIKDAKRYATLEFKELEISSKIDNVLCYNVKVKRDTLNSDIPLVLHYNICFSLRGYLILSGMPYRGTLLKYLTGLLHNGKFVFKPKFFIKEIVEEVTKKILQDGSNTMYRPRFHSSLGYRNREYNDFVVNEYKCATEDSEYEKIKKNCYYFEPIFKMTDIYNTIYGSTMNGKIDSESKLKISYEGRIYNSHAITFEEWIKFISHYLSWCV